MKGAPNSFQILSRRKQRGGQMNDTEDIEMLVSPQPYVDPFNKLNKEKDKLI